ncbi:hypothetical protein BGK67_01260 [Streptomyces subrutilus]|uniref:Uncharacterized protein n=1 Tax=Streptomyces subrutilus TaxID=36818 RepID=A0A1E5PKT3_9ACTN|nr:hypothetical protein BGK67_01260 [Streptomyces subrutilus]
MLLAFHLYEGASEHRLHRPGVAALGEAFVGQGGTDILVPAEQIGVDGVVGDQGERSRSVAYRG